MILISGQKLNSENRQCAARVQAQSVVTSRVELVNEEQLVVRTFSASQKSGRPASRQA